MKRDRDKKKKKRNREEEDDDLASMRKRYAAHRAKEDGTGGEKDESRYEFQQGDNNLRFLPLVTGKGKGFYKEGWHHYGVGPQGRFVRCIGVFNDKGHPLPQTKCPVCKRFLKLLFKANSKHKRGSEEGKAAWRKLKDEYGAKQRYVSNVLTEDGDVKWATYGDMIVGQLLEHYFEDGSKVGDFTDISDGRWMNIKRKGKGKNDTKYKVFPDDETSELEDWKKLKKKLHDLDSKLGPILDAKEIQAILDGDIDDDGDDDEEDDDDASADDGSEEEEDGDDESEDEDEDEEEERSSRRRKKKRKSRDDDDDDDDDESDEDDEDDDEDDEDDDEDDDGDDDDDDDGSDDESDEDEDEDEEDDEDDEEPVRRKKKRKKRF